MIQAYMQGLMAAIPMTPLMPNMMIEPIDQARAFLWLASDESRYVTGIELVVDGGMICH